MLCCVDVDYQAAGVTAACVGFEDWRAGVATIELVMRSHRPAAEYRAGEFYVRELPYLLALLERMPPIEIVIVDGYAWLGDELPGLGKHLHDACGCAVVGVAKTRFAGAGALEIVRGDSERPLFVTAVGVAPGDAAEHVRTMHGEYRIPTMLRRVDALARGHAR